MCVLVVPILFIGNPKQGKTAGGDERCRSSSNNNTYSEGGGGSNSNTCHKGRGYRKEMKGETTKVENEC